MKPVDDDSITPVKNEDVALMATKDAPDAATLAKKMSKFKKGL